MLTKEQKQQLLNDELRRLSGDEYTFSVRARAAIAAGNKSFAEQVQKQLESTIKMIDSVKKDLEQLDSKK